MVNDDQSEFRCPECNACRWYGELRLPGGMFVRCLECGWHSLVSEIEKMLNAEAAK